MVNSRVLVWVVTFVAAMLFTSAAFAQAVDACAVLQGEHNLCIEAAPQACDGLKARLAACARERDVAVAEVGACMAAGPVCEAAVVAMRAARGVAKTPGKATQLVCDAPAALTKGGALCMCPLADLIPVAVHGRPGHVACVAGSEVRDAVEHLRVMSRSVMTAEEAGKLKAYQDWITTFYVSDGRGGFSRPNYAAMAVNYSEFRTAFEPWQKEVDRRLGGLEQCLATWTPAACSQFPGVVGDLGGRARLDACLHGTGSCDEFGLLKGIEKLKKKSDVYVRFGPTVGIVSGPGSTQVLGGVSTTIVAPISDGVAYYATGAVGAVNSSDFGTAGFGRVSTGFEFKPVDAFVLGVGAYGTFIGRTSSLSNKRGETTVGTGQGGNAIGFEVSGAVEITESIRIKATPSLGRAAACRENVVDCRAPARGWEGGALLGLEFVFGRKN